MAAAGLLITRNVIVSLSTAVMFSSTVSCSVAFIAFEAVTILGGKLSVKETNKF